MDNTTLYACTIVTYWVQRKLAQFVMGT